MLLNSLQVFFAKFSVDSLNDDVGQTRSYTKSLNSMEKLCVCVSVVRHILRHRSINTTYPISKRIDANLIILDGHIRTESSVFAVLLLLHRYYLDPYHISASLLLLMMLPSSV